MITKTGAIGIEQPLWHDVVPPEFVPHCVTTGVDPPATLASTV